MSIERRSESSRAASSAEHAPAAASTGAVKWQRFLRFWPSVTVALLGTMLSLAASNILASREDRLAKLELQTKATDYTQILQAGISDYIGKLYALSAFFDASDRVTRGNFETFSRDILKNHSAIRALTWLPRVAHADRTEHEQAGLREGIPDYRMKSFTRDRKLQTAAEAPEYFPIMYNSATDFPDGFGLDLNSDQLGKEALQRAVMNDGPATSFTIPLMATTGRNNGFFMILPIYKRGQDRSNPDARRANLIGAVQGIFQTSLLIERSLGMLLTHNRVNIHVFPSREAETPTYFYTAQAEGQAAPASSRTALEADVHETLDLTVGDARWSLIATPAPGGPGTSSHIVSWVVLVAGLLTTALASIFLWTTARQASRLQAANETLDRTLGAVDILNGRLTAQNVRFDAALNNMSQGLVMFDAAERLVVCNERYIEMYNLSPEVAKPGCTLIDLLRHRSITAELDRDPDELRAEILASLKQPVSNLIYELKDGRSIAVANCVMADGGWVGTHEDITERRQAEAEISYMARHDALTNLPNRRLFHEELANTIGKLRDGQQLAVLCLDVDGFKGVNDTLGHPIGDLLLKAIADRLRGITGETALVARLGGDEFAIVRAELDNPAEATSLAARIIEAGSVPYELDGNQVVVGISVGVAIAPSDGTNSDDLLKNADMALYRAKADGRGVYRFFEHDMDARMQSRRAIELELRKAMQNGGFELHYQPLVDSARGVITGFEALMRWPHSERGMIPPLEFIPIAEETGLIIPLGEWALRQACTEAAGWDGDLTVAVNLSPVQFKSPNLLPVVVSALATSGLPASRLSLEITESVLLQDSDATLATLHRLRDLGVKISMDDFGTGYSSLGYLRKFPFDNIKIDQSFIRDMSDDSESLAIVRAVVGIGASLGLRTIAEGVETEEQSERLRLEGCGGMQGYYFGLPLPAAEIGKLLASMQPKRKATA